MGPLAKLFLEELKFELESIDIPPLGDGEFGRQRLEPTMQAIVFILKKLGDLSQAFDIGFGIDVDHMQSKSCNRRFRKGPRHEFLRRQSHSSHHSTAFEKQTEFTHRQLDRSSVCVALP